ncbi:DUF861 domain-containing protein [Duganella sp. FT80W]|uniref:DUF861 domain-containing protein n=1 Tax=Duganella guangzhouensis TaxID=2666084 RepID=A0A6I2L1W2_9BURK|nr:cupin domain-containing protein [Duganella guangzhouensis]MRW91792.1 DUF861 domain-containing protein [Duganella guangzhouensis]
MSKTVADIIAINGGIAQFQKLDYGMDEADWRASSGSNSAYGVGLWEGKPGEVEFPAMPYDEACWIIEGQVALIDEQGSRKEFGAGQGYILPKGFAGRWITIADAKKFYVTLE